MLTTNLRRGGLLDSAVMTVGKSSSAAEYGFANPATGSMSPDSLFRPCGNCQINGIMWFASPTKLTFWVDGLFANSGWEVLYIDGIKFTRSSASYYSGYPSTQWDWVGVSNPFGTTVGAARAIRWY